MISYRKLDKADYVGLISVILAFAALVIYFMFPPQQAIYHVLFWTIPFLLLVYFLLPQDTLIELDPLFVFAGSCVFMVIFSVYWALDLPMVWTAVTLLIYGIWKALYDFCAGSLTYLVDLIAVTTISLLL